MFISNFAKVKDNPNAVSISVGTPKWYAGKTYVDLFPPWSIVNRHKAGEMSNKMYEKIYRRRVLSKITQAQVMKELGDNAILVCWCSEAVFCHRRIVAAWMAEAGYILPEI